MNGFSYLSTQSNTKTWYMHSSYVLTLRNSHMLGDNIGIASARRDILLYRVV